MLLITTPSLLSCKSATSNNSDNGICTTTPADALGPYYIENSDQIEDINYSQLPGIKMLVTGAVFNDTDNKTTIPNAKIEIWHADHQGVYHPQANGDINDFNGLDVKLRGTIFTNQQGLYAFNSIRPGLYQPRPRHIHFKISAPGFKTIVTQSYFKNDTSNSSESIEDRVDHCLIIDFTLDDEETISGSIDFYLEP